MVREEKVLQAVQEVEYLKRLRLQDDQTIKRFTSLIIEEMLMLQETYKIQVQVMF